MDFEKFVEKFRERMLVTLREHYGPTDENEIVTEDYCYIMKADREISAFGVSFEFFFRPEANEVKVISFAYSQLMDYDLEAVFTANVVVKQIDDYINDSMIQLDEDKCIGLLTGERVQNTTYLMDGEYADLMVYPSEKWNPKTKVLEKNNQ